MEAAVKKLKDEMKKDKASYIQVVGKFLLEHLKKEPAFADKVTAAGKSIKGSLETMRSVAEKQKVGNVAVLSDEEGFAAVLDYFNTEEKKPVAKEEKKVEAEPVLEFDFLN